MPDRLRIYFDVSCLNRPFDEQGQERIRLETEAFLLIAARIQAGEWQSVGSEVVDLEIEQAPDADRRDKVQSFARLATEVVPVDPPILERAEELQRLGIAGADAVHLACAERAGVDVFLTTDDVLLRRARRAAAQVGVTVSNPLDWLREIEDR